MIPEVEYLIVLNLAFVIGFFSNRFIMLYPLIEKRERLSSILCKSLMFWSWTIYERYLYEQVEFNGHDIHSILQVDDISETGSLIASEI